MPPGGHSRSGPPPDPNALRRSRKSDKVNFTTLPARREGDPPAFPLPKPSRRERALWAQEWARPQAVMWEQLGLTYEVALYVRTASEAELPGATAQLRILVARQMDALGLTVPGMARNRWVMATDDHNNTAATTAPATASTRRSSARDRLKLLTGTEG